MPEAQGSRSQIGTAHRCRIQKTTGRTCSCFWLFSLRQIRDFSKKLVAYRRKFGVRRTVQLLEASGQPASFQNIHTPQANWARYTFLNWVINFKWDFAKYATVKVSDGLKKRLQKQTHSQSRVPPAVPSCVASRPALPPCFWTLNVCTLLCVCMLAHHPVLNNTAWKVLTWVWVYCELWIVAFWLHWQSVCSYRNVIVELWRTTTFNVFLSFFSTVGSRAICVWQYCIEMLSQSAV